MTTGRLTIGEFAKLCRLTVVALRHYDRVGLLTPAEIDTTSGYRYYRFDQVDTALRIGLLRSLDVSITDLRRIIDGSARLDDVLAAQRARLATQIDERRQMIDVIDALVDGAGAQQYEITRATEPGWQGLALDFETAWARVEPATRHGLARLAVGLRRAGIERGATTGALFPVTPVERVTVTVFAAFAGIAETATARRSALSPLTFASVDAVSTIHRGDHRLLSYAYHALLGRIAAGGLDAPGPAREYYLPPDDGMACTRLVIPLTGAPASAPRAPRHE